MMQVENTPTPKTIFLRNNPSVQGTLLDSGEAFTIRNLDLSPQKAPDNNSASSIKDWLPMPGINEYQNQLEKQGQTEQSMVISKGGQVVGSVGRNSEAMFQESSIQNLWKRANGNPASFAELLRQQGYEVDTFQPGEGPTYAAVHEMIHGESYETLIARQSVEYCRELSSWSGGSVY